MGIAVSREMDVGMRLWKGVVGGGWGGDGRLKRTRPLEPERWEKDGRIARSIRTCVHRRAKVARAEIFNIYIFLDEWDG